MSLVWGAQILGLVWRSMRPSNSARLKQLSASRGDYAGSSGPSQGLARRLRKEKQTKKGVDWWQRASTLASILSSVVIATAGILVTSSIQKSQLELAKAQVQITSAELDLNREKNRDEQLDQQTKLAADLFPRLVDPNPSVREFAVKLLRYRSPNSPTVDGLLAVLAIDDTNESVRKAAIKQLVRSDTTVAGETMRNIALDNTRSQEERGLAIQKEQEFVYRIFAASCPQENVLTVATGFRIKGVRGMVTTLNSIVGCKRLTTISNGKEVRLKLQKVDPNRDVALLVTDSPAEDDIDRGLEVSQVASPRQVWGLGYVTSTSFPQVFSGQVTTDRLVSMSSLRTDEGRLLVSELGTMGHDVQVLLVSMFVANGISGAPILDSDGKVIGLLEGSFSTGSSIAWVVPIKTVVWEQATDDILQQFSSRVAQGRASSRLR